MEGFTAQLQQVCTAKLLCHCFPGLSPILSAVAGCRCKKCQVLQDGIDNLKTGANQRGGFLVCREMARRDVHDVASHVGVTVAACPGVSQLAGVASSFQTLICLPQILITTFISFHFFFPAVRSF